MVQKPKTGLKNQGPSKTEEPASPRRSARSASKSPGRRAKPRSPSRTKSPSRVKKDVSPPPLRSSTPKVTAPKARSPIRRSPGRKSPPRLTKSAETFFSERVQRPRRTQIEVDTDSDTPDGDVPPEKPQAAIRGRSRRLEIQVEKLSIASNEAVQPRSFNLVRRITQNSQSREVERVVHLKHFDNAAAQKLGEFSDEDETLQLRKSVSSERSSEFKQVTEFGGSWGALFYTIFIPLSVIALLISCNANQCSFVQLPDYKNYLLLSTYFDLASILGYTAYAVVLALLSVVPFGGKHVSGLATKQGKYNYVMNGFFSCFIITAIAVALELRNIPIAQFVITHLFQIAIASFLFGFFLSTYAYVRSFYVSFSSINAHVLGRSRIYGFFMGRELNPRAFGLLDLKMYVFRLAVIGSFLLDVLILYKNLGISTTNLDVNSISVNPTLIGLILIHTIYYFDALVHEPSFVTSFEIQYEGFGYMGGVGYLIYPFMMASVTKYVGDYGVQLSPWKLILANLIFIFGYILFRGSNDQKDAFRKNPYDPALSHLDTIPTTKGKKLICSGFWGVVRHPNYLGDILMNISFIFFAPDVPPVLTAISIILLLIHRSVRDNVRCKQKYGAAWDRYCNKVKYVLLPKVY